MSNTERNKGYNISAIAESIEDKLYTDPDKLHSIFLHILNEETALESANDPKFNPDRKDAISAFLKEIECHMEAKEFADKNEGTGVLNKKQTENLLKILEAVEIDDLDDDLENDLEDDSGDDSGDDFSAWFHSANHRFELMKGSVCGCFYCLSIFPPKEIVEWCDGGETAICPYCGIDSIIGESSSYPITTEFLQRMHERWFEGGITADEEEETPTDCEQDEQGGKYD